MTSDHDLPVPPAGNTPPGSHPTRTRRRRAATLLATAAPLAAALAAAPAVATVAATAAPAAARTQALTAELLTAGTLPATTAGGTDPKLPPLVGD
jgi:hypothetical protein